MFKIFVSLLSGHASYYGTVYIKCIMYFSTAEQKVQQNAFNPKSDNSEVLIIRHLKGEHSKDWKFWFLQENALYQWNRQISGTCLKKTSKCLHINRCCIFRTHCLLLHQTPEYTEENADDRERPHDGYIQMYRGTHKSLARPTSRCILFDGENISVDANIVIYTNSINIPPIM